MKKLCLLLCLLCTVCCILLCGCSPSAINDGETYLEGTWYHSDGYLDVGYNLFADGGGFLFVGDNVSTIRYGIFEGMFYISANGETPTAMTFEETEDGLIIGGIHFIPVKEDPAVEESINQALSRAEENEETSSSTNIPFYITAAIALALVIFIMLWIVRMIRAKKSL